MMSSAVAQPRALRGRFSVAARWSSTMPHRFTRPWPTP